MYKVIFDTNLLKNGGFESFLGYRNDLQKFVKYCEILVPDIVIDEIKKQKIDNFNGEKNKLEANPVYKTFLSSKNTISEININERINLLQERECVKYEIIKLSKPEGILNKIKDLALNRRPPFKKNKDEGFKDAYIYFTILEYIQKQEDKVFFVATNDGTLKEALKNHSNIKIVESYENFKSNIIERYKDNYFIDTIKKELKEGNITSKSLIELWKSINENDVLRVDGNIEKYVLEIDNRTILGFERISEYSSDIENLINSQGFLMTHALIEYLSEYQKYFSDKEIENILDACFKNNKIHRVANDDDVKEFILNLYEPKKHLVNEKVKEFIEGLKNGSKETK